jgi:uncharacterized protein YbgA (DUF1722 family)/uncharacterized protein YbbK (DUF523 family)
VAKNEQSKGGAVAPWADEGPIRIGISSCLLGREVRFDGGHKHDRFLTDTVGAFVEFVPVCPEVEVGMGIPRESVRLVRRGDEVRMIAERSGTDHTAAMQAWCARRVRQLESHGLSGYVLKKGSPSCGMERVRVYAERSGMAERAGRGLFAEALLGHFVHLPVEEEGRLHDPPLRENFLERVFAYRRVSSFFTRRWTVGQLVAFHTAHKLQLMAHSPAHYRELGRLVAAASGADRDGIRSRYLGLFMEGLGRKATVRRHYNVLQHIAGYVRDKVDAADRAELHAVLDDYAAGLLPLIVPITLVRHHVRRLGLDYLAGQVYLEPHPKELMLRNHV